MTTLWKSNHPKNFWLCQPNPTEEEWQEAVRMAAPCLELPSRVATIDTLLALTLGEGRFGPHHWRLSPAQRLYYELKPFIPRPFAYTLRRLYKGTDYLAVEHWPVDERYVRFQWEIMRQLLIATRKPSLCIKHFWPEGLRFAFVLTHDIETEMGQAQARALADLEEDLGFRSSFNFIPERYRLDRSLIQELKDRGFEIGVHGLRHDGKLFRSRSLFMKRAKRINDYLKEFEAAGFRAPLTHRHPEWMQALEIEYDLSFFDTDPYEPVPGGCMSIWPFTIGRFVELPYTLVQDCTLFYILRETSPRLWLEKIDFIERYYGLALVNVHPDYCGVGRLKEIYAEFLKAIKKRGGYWNAIPREVARWWLMRAVDSTYQGTRQVVFANVALNQDGISIY